MIVEPRPDGVEEDLADQIDDLVPSYGYRKVPVVGLGGSAGSIVALQAFFTSMPLQSGLAFVVVIHLSPDHESILHEVLQRCTRMPVVKVQGTLKVAANTVYVIPPGKVLQSERGELRLEDIPEGRARHVVVDIFFRTLADSHGAHAAAVVLSGMDGDGAIGIKRIKERGGLTVAQDPDQAEHRGMPQSAIDTGMVDWVLPVQDMPARLLAYFRLEGAVELPPEDVPADGPRQEREEADLRDALALLRARTGRNFSQYKRATVLRRIGRRMQVNGIDNLPAYLTCLRTRPGECAALLQDLLISVTNFFRDAECFAALQARIPALFEGKGPNDAVRVWVVACATGEEAYSVAMLLAEHARTLEAPPMVQVFATDLDDHAVRAARDALYPAAIAADVSEERLRRFFVREHGGYRIRRELRELVLFALHDVLQDSPFSRQDLVTCRNLLIYLTRDAQNRVTETLHFALVPNGKLFLGSSESIDEGSPLFQVVDKKHRIYSQRPSSRAGLPLPQAATTLARAREAQVAARSGPVIAGATFDPPPPAGTRARGEVRTAAWGELHLQLLERMAPPSVLVDGEYDIVHLSPSAGRFLQMSGGEPSRNLLRAVEPVLRIDLRAALYQASQLGAEVQLQPMVLAVAGGSVLAAVRVIPAHEAGENLFLVLFDVRQPGETDEDKAARLEADPLARHLDAEIERLKSQLRETVEQYEAGTEELKASNEELQAMNEEMRAATEELETSREELQSINEELTTVNQELKSKVEELGATNSDLQNLMDASQIATIFLDRELCITRYTPAAVSLFNLIPGDLGRPLTNMATQLDYPHLAEDAKRVLQKLAPVEREVGQSDGSWYLARLVPYRTMDDRIAGLVCTFIDITAASAAAEALRRSEDHLHLVVENVVEYAILSTDLGRRVTSWNTGAQRLLGFSEAEMLGQPVDLIFTPEDRAQRVPDAEAETARREGRAADDRTHLRKDGTRFPASGALMLMRDADGAAVGFVKVLRDLSRQPPPSP